MRISSTTTRHPLALSTGRPSIAISPDGARLIALVERGDTTQILVREMGETAGRLVAGTEGALEPFLSLDGQQVGFIKNADWELTTVSLFGGAPTLWGRTTPVTRGFAWATSDQIVFTAATNAALDLRSVEVNRPLTTVDRQAGEATAQNMRYYLHRGSVHHERSRSGL